MSAEFVLYPYQEEGVAHLMSSLRASYLADKPGLGKTIQSLTAAKRMGAKSILILCPASIVNQWQDHVSNWCNATVFSYDSIAIGNVTAEELSEFRAYQNTLAALKANPKPLDPTWRERIKEASRKISTIHRTMSRKAQAKILRAKIRAGGPYDVIILDEAHYLKERGAHRTGYVFNAKHGVVKFGKKIMLLSGTPILNRPKELYPVLRACYPEALHDCPTFEAYAYKFCDGGYGFNGCSDFSGSSNPDILGKRLEGFMLARGLEVLGSKLPGLTYVDQEVTIDIIIDDDEHVATKRRLTGEAKVDKLVADIKRVSQTVKKLVVFYYHESVRVALQRTFPHAPLIKGGLTSFQKTQEIERFVKLKSEVMLVQLGAGGVGLDGLQYICSTGYLAELDWTPPLEEQAVGRLRRLGQTEHVTIYRPVGTKQGIDQKIDKAGKKKSVIISDILNHVTSKIVNVINRKVTHSMSDEQVVEQLLRIADALEALVCGGGIPASAAPKGGAKGTNTKPPKAKGMTLEEARAAIKGEANSVPAKTEIKMTAYKTLISDWGVKKIDDVTDDDRAKFVDSALVTMQKAAEGPAEAGDDDI